MRQRAGTCMAVALGVPALLISMTTLWAAEGGKKAAASPAMDQQAMMDAYMKAATPGPVHQEMAKLAGKWKIETTSWMMPGAPPETSQATAEYRLILGGRYLQQEVHGTMGEMSFEGMGIEGYDNVTKERFGLWIDSMSTGVMLSRGKCGAGEKTCTFSGSSGDPISGKVITFREVITKLSDDSFSVEMYAPDAKGKEYKNMRLVYTRE